MGTDATTQSDVGRIAAEARNRRRRAGGLKQPIARDRQRHNAAAIELLRSWKAEGDEQEQRETLAYLKQAVDESRPGQRKHFP
jgi:hypothetical protein